MNFLIILLNILFLVAIGYSIGELFLFDKSYATLKKLSLSYALGFGIVGLQLFFYFILGVKWNFLSIIAPWTLLLLVYLIKKRDTLHGFDIKKLFKRIKKLSVFEKVLIALIFSLILFVGIESVIRPVQSWDGWDNWVLRSNVFYTKNGIDPYYFKYTTDEYPLIVPLTVTFGYITLGKIDDTAILLFYFMFYFTLGAFLYTQSKEFLGLKSALVVTFLLLSTQNILRHGGRYEAGQADLAVGFYLFAGAILLYDYLKLKTKRGLLFLGVVLGISFQIKNDMLPFIALSIFIIVITNIKNRKILNLLYLLPLPLLLFSWQFFKNFNGLHTNYLLREGLRVHFDRLPNVLLEMSKEFINFQNWNLLWVVFILCLLLFYKKLKIYWLFITIILFQWFSYMIIFLVTPVDPIIQINAVVNKLYLHIAPLAILVIGLLCNNSIGFMMSKQKPIRKS